MKKCIDLFISFFKIGLYTFGGGYAMIMLIDHEVTKRRGWCSEEEFIDFLALGQSSPGPIAINTSVIVGYHVHGWRGALAAALGSALPSFLILLIIAIFFTKVDDMPIVRDIFKGMRPAVVALILYPVFSFAKHVKRIEYPLFVAIAAFIYLGVSPIIFIIVAILWGVVVAYKASRR